jgi:hypothetical protein
MIHLINLMIMIAISWQWPPAERCHQLSNCTMKAMIRPNHSYLLFGLLFLHAGRNGAYGFLLENNSLSPIIPNQRRQALYVARLSLTDIPVLDPLRSPPKGAEILSEDPLVYRVPNFLSENECLDFLERAKALEATRPMILSNPPEVSLNVKKLWPLPFLSIAAALPPLIRYSQETGNFLPTPAEFGPIVLPSVVGAFVGSIALAYGVVLPLVKKISSSSSRTSFALALNEEEDVPYVNDLVSRVSTATNHPWQKFEAPVFTRYTSGAIFAKHSDASPTRGSEWKDEGGQRVVTCICYLNTVQKGGETAFDRLRFAVGPVQGSALIFFPTIPGDSLDVDELLTHESMPSEEEKCIIQMFGRVGPRVPPPLGLPDSFGKI